MGEQQAPVQAARPVRADASPLPDLPDQELEQLAALVPVPRGIELKQGPLDDDGQGVELVLRRWVAARKDWRHSALPWLLAAVPLAIILALVAIFMAAPQAVPLDLALRLVAGVVVPLSSTLVLAAAAVVFASLRPAARVRVDGDGLHAWPWRVDGPPAWSLPLDQVAGIFVDRALGTWAVMLRDPQGQVRTLVPMITSEAHANALALWIRVGLARVR